MEQHYNQSADLFFDEPVIYGRFGERFGAAILDGLILLIPNLALTYLVPEPTGSIIMMIMYWLYDAIQESGNSQATFGKKVLGLKVTTTGGERLSFAQATGRHFGKYLSMIILFIGYLMNLWDDRKQTLHDKMANTLVVIA